MYDSQQFQYQLYGGKYSEFKVSNLVVNYLDAIKTKKATQGGF